MKLIHTIRRDNVGKHVFQMDNGGDYVMGSASGPVKWHHVGTKIYRTEQQGTVWIEPEREQSHNVHDENDRLMDLLAGEVDAFAVLATEGETLISSLGGRRRERVRFVYTKGD